MFLPPVSVCYVVANLREYFTHIDLFPHMVSSIFFTVFLIDEKKTLLYLQKNILNREF